MSIIHKPVLGIFCVACILTAIGSTFYYNSIIADKDDEISSLKAQVASLQAEADQLKTRIAELTQELEQKNGVITDLTSQIDSLNKQSTDVNNQIAELNAQIAELTGAPKLVLEGLLVEDDRNGTQPSLHVTCRVNNTGGRTAYNAYLHVGASNAEGMAIDYLYSFTGITAHQSLGLDFRVNYTGSPIENWSVDPIWTDKPQTGESNPAF